jgi:hypothetical protein
MAHLVCLYRGPRRIAEAPGLSFTVFPRGRFQHASPFSRARAIAGTLPFITLDGFQCMDYMS